MSTIAPNVDRLDPYLQEVMRKGITLKEDEVKRANLSLGEVILKKIQEEMKNVDETFKLLYKQLHFVGSYYENLRVGEPSEFDINLELQLPMNTSDIKIETGGTKPGFANIVVGTNFNARASPAVVRKIESWLEGRYLCRDKVIQWLQGVVDKVLKTVRWRANMTVRRKMSGPAVTLDVTDGSRKYSVDLVPVFTFETSRWPPKPLRTVNSLPRTIKTSTLKWCIVPKAPRQLQSSWQWRMSFYLYEKELMNDLNNMKPVLKLIKLLRDNERWAGLSSYYIKTLFLWEMDNQKQDPKFWRNGLGNLLMHMLGKLEDYLQKSKIPFYWDQRCNLIEHLGEIQIKNMCGRVTRLKRQLLTSSEEDCRSLVRGLFTP